MKKIKLIGLLLFFTIPVFAQDRRVVDEKIGLWIKYFNGQKFTEVYSLYGSPYQAKVNVGDFKKEITMVFGMMGKLKSADFVSYKDHVYKYIFYANKNQIEADVTLVIDRYGKFNYLNFDAIGGKGDPPRAQSEIISND